MTAQELLQFLLVLGRHVVEDGLVDPLLVVEIRPPLLFQVDMRLSQNHLQISALRGHPAVQEIGRVISEPQQEISLGLRVLHALNVLHDLLVLGVNLFWEGVVGGVQGC